METKSNPNRKGMLGAAAIAIGAAIASAARSVNRQTYSFSASTDNYSLHIPQIKSQSSGVPYIRKVKGWAAQRRNAKRRNNLRVRRPKH